MNNVLFIVVSIVLLACAAALIVLVLMQKGSQGGGLGAAFGGSSDNFYGKNKAKSLEGKLERYTKILGVVIALLSIATCLIIKLSV